MGVASLVNMSDLYRYRFLFVCFFFFTFCMGVLFSVYIIYLILTRTSL